MTRVKQQSFLPSEKSCETCFARPFYTPIVGVTFDVGKSSRNGHARAGTNEEISRWIRKNTKVIELKERTVVPGFIDTHVHVVEFGRFLAWIDLKGVRSIEEMKKRIRKRPSEVRIIRDLKA